LKGYFELLERRHIKIKEEIQKNKKKGHQHLTGDPTHMGHFRMEREAIETI
jgi:hypothetical protein